MPKRSDPGRRGKLHDTGSVDQRLARLLDTPHLARLVPHLAPETLHQLIRYRGLDACGELVAAATPAQLKSVLDLDLWRSNQPGRDERFDEARFGEWIEFLVDSGGSAAARTVAAIDEPLVIAGLARYVRVFDHAAFAPAVSSDDEPFDVAVTPAGDLACEVGGYLVRARRADAWDAIVTLLLALDTDHRDYFHAVMRGCRRLSNSAPEIDGLDDLLDDPAQLLHDVELEREHRRTQRGYLTPADARAFLQMAKQAADTSGRMRRRSTRSSPPTSGRPTTRKRHPPTAARNRQSPPSTHRRAPQSPTRSTPSSICWLRLAWCQGGPRALLGGTTSQPPRLTLVQRLMEHVRDTDDTAHLARSREMAFLANTLMAGCSVQARPFTAQEASDAAIGICNLGLEHWPETLPETFLVDHDLVTAFEAGWAVLHQDVSLFVTDHLIGTLTDLQSVDAGDPAWTIRSAARADETA